MSEVKIYQAGTAEYAQIQAARLCQLHNCLEEGNKKTKAGFEKTRDMGKKKKEKRKNNHWEIHLTEVYLAPQQKTRWQCRGLGWDFQLNDSWLWDLQFNSFGLFQF